MTVRCIHYLKARHIMLSSAKRQDCFCKISLWRTLCLIQCLHFVLVLLYFHWILYVRIAKEVISIIINLLDTIGQRSSTTSEFVASEIR